MDRGAGGGRRVDLELMRTPQPKERADAARNRVKVLDAAAELFARHGSSRSRWTPSPPRRAWARERSSAGSATRRAWPRPS